MIFVGRGALLRRAVAHALATGHRVDLVVSEDPDDRPHDRAADGRAVPFTATTDVNAVADRLLGHATDGVVWSVNNRLIFREPLLGRGLRIHNIHNGLLPQHRGLPSAAVAYALLNGDREYGATLHEVDAGVDTGRVLAELPFPLAADARFHRVLLRGIQACQQLFERSLDAVAAGRPIGPPAAREPRPAGYHSLRALRELPSYAGHPAYRRATDVGVAAPFVPELVEVLRAAAGADPGYGGGLRTAGRTIDGSSHNGVTDG
ncbi:formyltransferase family protein [Kitasatospora sp. MBT63]|uniref:formyltransferase family protein n=1 Tax=Kitasatospora sp. MBT63 TaxID=1444768 RepID=UPI0007C76C70|nr:formyltransferase family protein [Kitasatospora sp. MBT63]